eukprot:TRINITY_DN180_c0_g2_i6.p1 TRINITY_DN180_c0_g2~~TRINITY_DN180_c0_g2_i6.p1  ORF type:complete len:791 (+),score=217.74 TRINITY_DN180_c0_g2_i6:112-2484(+)
MHGEDERRRVDPGVDGREGYYRSDSSSYPPVSTTHSIHSYAHAHLGTQSRSQTDEVVARSPPPPLYGQPPLGASASASYDGRIYGDYGASRDYESQQHHHDARESGDRGRYDVRSGGYDSRGGSRSGSSSRYRDRDRDRDRDASYRDRRAHGEEGRGRGHSGYKRRHRSPSPSSRRSPSPLSSESSYSSGSSSPKHDRRHQERDEEDFEGRRRRRKQMGMGWDVGPSSTGFSSAPSISTGAPDSFMQQLQSGIPSASSSYDGVGIGSSSSTTGGGGAILGAPPARDGSSFGSGGMMGGGGWRQPPEQHRQQPQQQGGGGYYGRGGDYSSSSRNPELRPLKRLYVGALPIEEGINEQDILDLLNHLMVNTGVPEFQKFLPGPVFISCNLNRSRCFAFVEARTPEEATMGLLLDGARMKSTKIKVRRVRDYRPLPGYPEHPPSNIHVPGIVSADVGDGDEKLFIGGVPPGMAEVELEDLMATGGNLKSFNLVRDPASGISKGFAFCMYETPEETDRAIELLNGRDIGGKILCVQRASVGKGQRTAPPNMMGMSGYDRQRGGGSGGGGGSVGGAGLGSGRFHLAPTTFSDPVEISALSQSKRDPKELTSSDLLKNTAPVELIVRQADGALLPSSRVLVLYNILDVHTVDDTKQFQKVRAELISGLEQFGPVDELFVPLRRAHQIAERIAYEKRVKEARIRARVAADLGEEVSPEDAEVVEKAQIESSQSAIDSHSDLSKELGILPAFARFRDEESVDAAVKGLNGKTFLGHVFILSRCTEDDMQSAVDEDNAI